MTSCAVIVNSRASDSDLFLAATPVMALTPSSSPLPLVPVVGMWMEETFQAISTFDPSTTLQRAIPDTLDSVRTQLASKLGVEQSNLLSSKTTMKLHAHSNNSLSSSQTSAGSIITSDDSAKPLSEIAPHGLTIVFSSSPEADTAAPVAQSFERQNQAKKRAEEQVDEILRSCIKKLKEQSSLATANLKAELKEQSGLDKASYDRQFEKLNTQINQQADKIDKQANEIDKLNTQAASHNQEVEDLKTKINQQTLEIDELKTGLWDLQDGQINIYGFVLQNDTDSLDRIFLRHLLDEVQKRVAELTGISRSTRTASKDWRMFLETATNSESCYRLAEERLTPHLHNDPTLQALVANQAAMRLITEPDSRIRNDGDSAVHPNSQKIKTLARIRIAIANGREADKQGLEALCAYNFP